MDGHKLSVKMMEERLWRYPGNHQGHPSNHWPKVPDPEAWEAQGTSRTPELSIWIIKNPKPCATGVLMVIPHLSSDGGCGVISHGTRSWWAMKFGFFHQDVKEYPGGVQDWGRGMTQGWIIMEGPSTPGNTWDNSVKILRATEPSVCNYHLGVQAWGFKHKDHHMVVLCKWCDGAELPGGLTVRLLPTKLPEEGLWVTALRFNILSYKFCVPSFLFGMGSACPGRVLALQLRACTMFSFTDPQGEVYLEFQLYPSSVTFGWHLGCQFLSWCWSKFKKQTTPS